MDLGPSPIGPFAQAAYEELATFLLDQLGLKRTGLDIYSQAADGGVVVEIPPLITDADGKPIANTKFPVDIAEKRADRIAVPGVVSGQSRLFSGQNVPNIAPEMRGTASWSVDELLDAMLRTFARKKQAMADTDRDAFRELLHRVLERFGDFTRNPGNQPDTRALNYASTNVYQLLSAVATRVLAQIEIANAELDSIDVRPSATCRFDSVCFDVEVAFFDRSNFLAARSVVAQTVDVSDIVPVMLGTERFFVRR